MQDSRTEVTDVDWERGRITDDGLEFMRSMIGVRRSVPAWNREVTADGIWHFALGIGDDNPLWWDEAYAVASPHEGLVAPPCYLYSHTNGLRWRPEDGRATTDLFLPGVLGLWAGERWRWHRPVRPGEIITADVALTKVDLREAGQFGGKSVSHEEHKALRTHSGELVAEIFTTIKRFERETARERGSYADRPLARYEQEDRDRIEMHYETEAERLRRGPVPRYFEDVVVGDKIGPMLKGPLTVNNLVGFMLGWGSGLNATNRMFFSQLKREPGTKMIHPDSGVPENYESPHWDAGLARLSGLPGGYDFGCQRFAWFSHLVSDWAGDHGFLTDLDFKLLKPNIINDLTWIEGEVTSVDRVSSSINLELRSRNQLDQLTARGIASVRLPRRDA